MSQYGRNFLGFRRILSLTFDLSSAGMFMLRVAIGSGVSFESSFPVPNIASSSSFLKTFSDSMEKVGGDPAGH